MELDDLWAEATASIADPISTQNIKSAMMQDSSSQTAELTKRVRYQRNYAIGFLGAFLILAPELYGNEVAFTSICVAIVLYVIGGFALHRGYKKLEQLSSFEGNTLQKLELELEAIDNTLRINKLWGLFSLPVILFCGLAIGYAQRVDPTFTELFSDAAFLKTAVIALIVGVPIAGWIAGKMTRSAFDNLADSLRENVLALKKLEEMA